MPRVLITGATGFLGSYLTAFLRDNGYEVFGTGMSTSSDEIRTCDIGDMAEVEAVIRDIRPDAVLHCAAISSVTSAAAADYYQTNVIGTENVLRASIASGAERFVHLSTAGVYGNQDAELLSEGMCPKPVHHYGMSKFCSERVLMNYSEEISVSIVRPFNIIGKGQNKNFIVPKLVDAFKRREPVIRLGNIDVYRDYIDINDTVKIVHALMTGAYARDQTFNICTGRPVSIKELIAMLQELTSHEIRIEVNEQFVRKNEVWKLLGDPGKLQSVLGDNFAPTTIRETLIRMLQD